MDKNNRLTGADLLTIYFKWSVFKKQDIRKKEHKIRVIVYYFFGIPLYRSVKADQ